MENRVIVTGKEIRKEFGYFPLLRLAIAVTGGCNLQCIHCSQNSGITTRNELSTRELLKVIDDAKKIGLITLPITGGEPFARRDIIRMR